jgi:hypothetical protein
MMWFWTAAMDATTLPSRELCSEWHLFVAVHDFQATWLGFLHFRTKFCASKFISFDIKSSDLLEEQGYSSNNWIPTHLVHLVAIPDPSWILLDSAWLHGSMMNCGIAHSFLRNRHGLQILVTKMERLKKKPEDTSLHAFAYDEMEWKKDLPNPNRLIAWTTTVSSAACSLVLW